MDCLARMEKMMQDVFIIGSRGLPARYGGFETFVSELINHQKSFDIKYHVACLSDKEHHTHFNFADADCFTINPPQLGPARVIAYDIMAINYALDLVKTHDLKEPIFYILGNTIGAFIWHFANKIHKVGGLLYVNPDGLEWKRSKWSRPTQRYLKYAEKCMTKNADLIISDNIGIENYIQSTYSNVKTRFIAYGTEINSRKLSSDDPRVKQLFKKWNIKSKGYYLIVGRFVPENNYETAIREFMASDTKRDLVIICNHQNNPYFEKLSLKTNLQQDKRVKFVGTLYEKDLLDYVRQQAFAYIHGHEVGGTNPGLLEALANTDLNLVLDVDFNKSVAGLSSFYWAKKEGDLAKLINDSDQQQDLSTYGDRAKAIIQENYTWKRIVEEYEDLFLNES